MKRIELTIFELVTEYCEAKHQTRDQGHHHQFHVFVLYHSKLIRPRSIMTLPAGYPIKLNVLDRFIDKLLKFLST